jgi:hypothetical protein
MFRFALTLVALAALSPCATAQSCYPPRAVVDLGGGCGAMRMRVLVDPASCDFGIATFGGTQAPEMMLFVFGITPMTLPLPSPPFPQNCVLPHDLTIVLPRSGRSAWWFLPRAPIPTGTSLYLTALPGFPSTPTLNQLQPWLFTTNTVRWDW